MKFTLWRPCCSPSTGILVSIDMDMPPQLDGELGLQAKECDIEEPVLPNKCGYSVKRGRVRSPFLLGRTLG
ncbi:hypothetical protein CPC08DRAFT_702688 [Agrocybe pediades]|nr:hypothetical protein CPC08DRAFT_702688 [Agrocybe pediades]